MLKQLLQKNAATGKPCNIGNMLYRLASLSVLVASVCGIAQAYPGLPTRDQNPLLQSYFIPAINSSQNPQGFNSSQTLYITNTYQKETVDNESLLIDGENIRLDLLWNGTVNKLLWNINLSLIQHSAGSLDSLINEWHELLDVPDAGRSQTADDQFHMLYIKNGEKLINRNNSIQGISDVQLSLGYAVNETTEWWIAVEIPTHDDDLLSDHAVNLAIWLQSDLTVSKRVSKLLLDSRWYTAGGLSFVSDQGWAGKKVNTPFLFAQFGTLIPFFWHTELQLQADYHSPIIKNSHLKGLGHSLQGQFGLKFPQLTPETELELFFSEDIWPGHAPDISFNLKFSSAYE